MKGYSGWKVFGFGALILAGAIVIFMSYSNQWFSQSAGNIKSVIIFYHNNSVKELKFWPDQVQQNEIFSIMNQNKKFRRNSVDFSQEYVTIQVSYRNGKRDDFYYSFHTFALCKEKEKRVKNGSTYISVGVVNEVLAAYLKNFFIEKYPDMKQIMEQERAAYSVD